MKSGVGIVSEHDAVTATINAFNALAKAALDAVAALEGNPRAADAPPPEAPAPKPLKLEDVRAVLAEKSRAGYTDKVRELLIKHGAEKLSEIAPDKYAALLADVEGLK
jgi:phospholipase/lecithinase/hemolysin